MFKQFNSENLSNSIKSIEKGKAYKLIGLFDGVFAEFFIKNGICNMFILDKDGDASTSPTNPPSDYILVELNVN